jgi:hypothetical protein
VARKAYADTQLRARAVHAANLTPLTDAAVAASGRKGWKTGRWGRAVAVMRFLRWVQGVRTAKVCDPTRTLMQLRRNFGADGPVKPVADLAWHWEDDAHAPYRMLHVSGLSAAGTTDGWGAEVAVEADADGGLPRAAPARLLGAPASADADDANSPSDAMQAWLAREKRDALAVADRLLARHAPAPIPAPEPAATPAKATASAKTKAATRTKAAAQTHATALAMGSNGAERSWTIQQPLRALFHAVDDAGTGSMSAWLAAVAGALP